MRHRLKRFRFYAAIPLGMLILMGVDACEDPKLAATSSAFCGYIMGNGQDDNDARVHDVMYQNQTKKYYSSDRLVKYVPCNSRTYIISDGEQKDANGEIVGDRKQLSRGFTSTGTAIGVGSRTSWTLNQHPVAMGRFGELCIKFNCWSDQPVGGQAKFSTPGWNGLLGEYLSPVIDKLVLKAAEQMGDEIWRKPTAKQFEDMADYISNNFKAEMKRWTGYNVDLFCGAGNSRWPDSNEPGEGAFTCTNPRVEVDFVVVNDPKLKTLAASAIQIEQELNDKENQAAKEESVNRKRLEAAQAAYGDSAGYWMGLQDTVRLCTTPAQKANVPPRCVINIRADTAG